YGIHVMLPAVHLEPGCVDAFAASPAGGLDVGRYPSGSDATADALAGDLTAAGFVSRARDEIMPLKYAKLVMNLGNALEAACGNAARTSDLARRAAGEARTCFAAAGIALAQGESDAELAKVRMRPIAGGKRSAGSSWQSLARGTGSIEADYLNG